MKRRSSNRAFKAPDTPHSWQKRIQFQLFGGSLISDPTRRSQINGSLRTVSAGGGHGPILLGKSEAGGGQLCRPRDLLIPTWIYREIFYLRPRFLHWACKKSRILVKKSNWFELCSSRSALMYLFIGEFAIFRVLAPKKHNLIVWT